MNIDDPTTVACCFCGHSVKYEDATRLIVVPPRNDGSEQELYCHGAHLRAAIVKEIVLLEELSDDVEDQRG